MTLQSAVAQERKIWIWNRIKICICFLCDIVFTGDTSVTQEPREECFWRLYSSSSWRCSVHMVSRRLYWSVFCYLYHPSCDYGKEKNILRLRESPEDPKVHGGSGVVEDLQKLHCQICHSVRQLYHASNQKMEISFAMKGGGVSRAVKVFWREKICLKTI